MQVYMNWLNNSFVKSKTTDTKAAIEVETPSKASFEVKTQEVYARKLMLLVTALERILASLLSAKLVGNRGFCLKLQWKQEFEAILTTKLALKR